MATALAANYERLRRAVLDGNPGGWRLGHGVLVTRGMAAWVAAWTAPTGAPEAETTTPILALDPHSHTQHPDAPTSRPGADPMIVTVLAQMALAHA